MMLIASRDDRSLASRAVAMMRHGFGGHAYGPNEPTRRERETGRVGGFEP
jgi:6-phosphogluconate dehydrogenase